MQMAVAGDTTGKTCEGQVKMTDGTRGIGSNDSRLFMIANCSGRRNSLIKLCVMSVHAFLTLRSTAEFQH